MKKLKKERLMYKLVAIDLDGTMLNSYGIVTQNTKNIIKENIKKGTKIIIASGRTISSIKPIAEEIGNNDYFIAGNGSLIYDAQKEEIIYDKFIPKEKMLEIINICDANSIFYTVYTDKEIITEKLKYNVLYYYNENKKKEEEKRTNIKIVDNIKKYIENQEDDKYLKIMICDESKLVFNSIIKKMKDIKNIEVLEVGHMSRKIIKQGTEEVPIEYYYTEITLEDVDKWNAIKYLIEKLNIKKEEVIAIGDNVNDKKMVENAGLGIAMGGSTPNLTSVADFITKTSDEDGVAYALNKFLN
jgi:cof-like hydrolase